MLSSLHWRRQWHPTLLLLPGKFHGRRTLVGCSPWGREESDTTEWLPFYFSLSRIGEGNGNPLQCSCLKNPRDGGIWWVSIYGVTQSRTGLKWLSSSSNQCWRQELWVRSLGQEDPLEEEMASHSSIVWRILCTEEPRVHGFAKSQTWLKQLSTG